MPAPRTPFKALDTKFWKAKGMEFIGNAPATR
jgi:hypothetical protein